MGVITSLEPRYYLSDTAWVHEQERVFTSTWIFAAHKSVIERPGDYHTVEVAGESLILVRDRHMSIHCYYNVCQHRAHQLVAGSGNASVLVCPYHAWTYKLTGELLKGPNLKAVEGLDRTQICLTAVQVEDFHGFLFVNLDPEAAPMDAWFPGVRAQLKAFVPNIDELKPLEWVEVQEACNWKVSVENYSECYHCTINHPTFSQGVVKPATYDIQPQGYCLRHTTECQNLAQMTYPIDLEANEYAGAYSSWYLWPTVSFQVYPGNVLNTYHWEPIDPGHVLLKRGWYTPGGEESQVIRALAVQDRETTVEEDIGLIESVQRGLKSRGYRPGPLVLDPQNGVNSEHSIKALHDWIREAHNG